MSHQAIADVKEGIESYKYLLDKGELASATERLQETFMMGEYVSYVRTLPRDATRRALDYSQKGNQLLSAIDVKDYAKAESLIKDIEGMAKDFDSSPFMGPIETAKKVSAMHLAKAKNAAMTGDEATMQTELTAATEIWPRNPQLEEAAKNIFAKGDVQNQAVIDFDRMVAQKNYRGIYDDRMKFIAAMATYPDKAKELKKVLEDMGNIEMSLVRAQELAKRNEFAGAWESVDRAADQYPDDLKLAQVRADYTTRAAEFVNCIRRAQDLEKKKQYGSSLTWFLRARRLCPTSEFAKEGIDRIVNELMPTDA
jgi:DNA replication initiation complex subunit (GINS family)